MLEYDSGGIVKPECLWAKGQLRKDNPFQYVLKGKDGRWYLSERDLLELIRVQGVQTRVLVELYMTERALAIERWKRESVEREKEDSEESDEEWVSREYQSLCEAVNSVPFPFMMPGIWPISFEQAQEDWKRSYLVKIPKR